MKFHHIPARRFGKSLVAEKLAEKFKAISVKRRDAAPGPCDHKWATWGVRGTECAACGKLLVPISDPFGDNR